MVAAGPEHPVRFADAEDGGFRPYLLVRGRLEAALTRALAIDLADLIEKDAAGLFLVSNGARFDVPQGAA